MSFRTRLTGFFILIVVVPMVAVGFLVFRLIGDSEQGKADARASGLASSAASLYRSASAAGSGDAKTTARALGATGSTRSSRAIRATVATLAARAGLARVTVTIGS